MSETVVQRYYRYQARIYDCTRWLVLNGRRRAVECLELKPDSRVLDIGCGTGLNFRHILARLDKRSGGLTGVDFSADMLKRAKRRIDAQGWSNVELIQADVEALALSRQFDAILFAYSLSMMFNWPAALDRARAHLKPGGRLVVLDFGDFHEWGPLGVLVRGWLKLNHVDTKQDYLDKLNRDFSKLEVDYWLGGYRVIAVAR